MTVVLREAEVLAPGEGTIVPLPGATMVFKALSGLGVGDFLVGEFTAEAGFDGPRPHLHRVHVELFYVLDGEFDFFLEDQTVRVGAGTFITVPPGSCTTSAIREIALLAGSASPPPEASSSTSRRSTNWPSRGN